MKKNSVNTCLLSEKYFLPLFLSNTHIDIAQNNFVPALEVTNYFQPYKFVTAIGRICPAPTVLLTRAVRIAQRNKIQYLEKTPQEKKN